MSRKAMQVALEALELYQSKSSVQMFDDAVKALRQALETEQEPVAWMYVNKDGECEQIEYGPVLDDPGVTPLYTAPPKRELTCVCGAVWEGEMMVHSPRKAAEWFDCTDAQLIDEVRRRGFVIRDAQIDPVKREWVGLTPYEIQEIHSGNQHWGNFACAIEAKLKEKNHG